MTLLTLASIILHRADSKYSTFDWFHLGPLDSHEGIDVVALSSTADVPATSTITSCLNTRTLRYLCQHASDIVSVLQSWRSLDLHLHLR